MIHLLPFVDSSSMGVLTVLLHILGLICAGFAIWRSKTAQGTTAWVLALISFPLFAIPLYFIFSPYKFVGYADERREFDQTATREIAEIQKLFSAQIPPPARLSILGDLLKDSGQPAFTGGNRIQLLVNGSETYQSILQAIEGAQKYILFQFFTFVPDEIGKEFTKALKAKAREGLRVYFLYDEIGCKLDSSFLKDLTSSGIQASSFNSTKGLRRKFQINFRNHRKLVILDGKIAFLGGLNVSEDYVGRGPMGPWRDTDVRIEGAGAVATQLSFLKDWYWAKEEVPDLDWEPHPASSGSELLVLHTGPSDDRELCLMSLVAMVNLAKKSIVIANPYFVPPDSLVTALALAVFRGVDVRILVPDRSDNKLVKWASEVHQEHLIQLGIKIFKYLPGFAHQKVFLIDEALASVGSVNLDSRSIFINFEIMAISLDKSFAGEVEAMLAADFKNSVQVTLNDLQQRPLLRRLLPKVARLFSPLL